MRYLSIWMLASECGGKGEGRVNWLLNFTYLACALSFTNMCICIIPIANLLPE